MVEYLGVGLALIAAVGLALQAVLVRQGTIDGTPEDALYVVLFTNAAVIIPIAAVLHFPDYGLTPFAAVAFAATGLVGMLAGRLFLYQGIDRVGASRSESVKASSPLIATLLAVVFLGETLTPTHLLGIVLVAGGIALVSSEATGHASAGRTRVSLTGLAFPALSAICFAIEPNLAKWAFSEQTPPLVGAAVLTAAATFGIACYRWWTIGEVLPVTLHGQDLRWYVGAGIVSSVAVLAYFTALELAPVVLVVPILQTSPLFVVGFSLVWLSGIERVTARVLGASLLIVFGAVLITVVG